MQIKLNGRLSQTLIDIHFAQGRSKAFWTTALSHWVPSLEGNPIHHAVTCHQGCVFLHIWHLQSVMFRWLTQWGDKKKREIHPCETKWSPHMTRTPQSPLSIKQVCASKKKKKKKGKVAVSGEVSDGSAEEFYSLSQIAQHSSPSQESWIQKLFECSAATKLLDSGRSAWSGGPSSDEVLHSYTTCMVYLIYYTNPHHMSILPQTCPAALISQLPTRLLCWPWNAAVSFPSSRRQSWAAPSPLTASEAEHDRAHLFIYLKNNNN